MKQKDIAKYFNASDGTISDIKKGRKNGNYRRLSNL